MEAVAYGSVYVARVAMGGSDMQTVKAFQEAEAYNGPAIIIAYSHCIAHGYELAYGMEQQKNAVLSGYWPLMRYNPALRAEGKNPFHARLEGAVDTAEAVQLSRGAVHHAGAQPSGGCEEAAAGSAGRCGARVESLLRPRRHGWTRRNPRTSHHRNRRARLRLSEREGANMIDLSTAYLGPEAEEPAGGFFLAVD